eukprot:TRINITY_DN94750_c0_g1_i1.p1 TRINITY_DN94750_c0_g1~~TRINITY_DN94750_c0_g1_i1.p1  ORF type:complete len:508 (+),score=92.70 TRINITY_DN94750_c0_g1_i1:138-1661(+)
MAMWSVGKRVAATSLRASPILLPRPGTLSLSAEPLQRRRSVTTVCADTLGQLEEGLIQGFTSRLQVGGAVPSNARVVVAGTPSIELAATVRAARRCGLEVAPLHLHESNPEVLASRLGEVEGLQLAVVAGSLSEWDAAAMRSAAQQVCVSLAMAGALHAEGSYAASLSAEAKRPENEESASLLLYSRLFEAQGTSPLAQIPSAALKARVESSKQLWSYSSDDTVLCLGLAADSAATIVDALEAPLAAGARIGFSEPSPARGKMAQAWNYWKAVFETPDATTLFVDSQWCWSLLDTHSQLSPELQQELQQRRSERPLRRVVIVAPASSSISPSFVQRWSEIFGVAPVWLFTSAETGSLYTTSLGETSSHVGPEDMGLEWRLSDKGELVVKGDSVFAGYMGRPRSSLEMLLSDPNEPALSFCRTGHLVEEAGAPGKFQPQLERCDTEFVDLVNYHLCKGPKVDDRKMKADWRVKKVMLRKYYYYMGPQRYRIWSKKHNHANLVHNGKYK